LSAAPQILMVVGAPSTEPFKAESNREPIVASGDNRLAQMRASRRSGL
jgi:hypothetical protein